MIISTEQFWRHFTSFRSSATRIEALPAYADPDEAPALRYYLSGAALPRPLDSLWARNVRQQAASGGYMGRVRVIDRVLSPYLQFEVDCYYGLHEAAGEDIRFAFRDEVAASACTDAWLIDDEMVLDLSYDDSGSLLRVTQDDRPGRVAQARAAWQEARRHAFPLAELHALLRGSDRPVPARRQAP